MQELNRETVNIPMQKLSPPAHRDSFYRCDGTIKKELVPIRHERHFPRLKTAHFRKLKYLIYRPS